MKKLLVALFALLSINTFAQRWETVKGNGQAKKETREVSSFSSLSSQGSMDVQIAYGNSNSVVIDADENLLPYIETTVENGKLTIKNKKGINLKSSSKILVNVSMTKINSLQLSGSGNLSGSGAFNNDSKTDIAVSGSGNLKLDFDSFKDLDVTVSGSGNVDLKGKSANNIDAKISGSGNIDCSDLSSKDVTAKISGSGNIKVYASNSIDAKISGSGSVYYKGNLQNIQTKIAGSGRVSKM